MSISIHKLRFILTGFVTGLTLLASAQIHAEYFGLPNGRSADLSSMPAKSVEAGFVTGDLADVSYQGFGIRFNALVSPDSMFYFDINQTEIEDADGTILGIGFFYQLEGLLQNTDTAIKGAFHDGKVKQDGFRDLKGKTISVEALFSGKKMGESNLRWYGNVGIHKFDFDNYDETEIGFGGGVFMPTSFGEFFAGADMIDELTFGAGVRYFLQ